MTVLEGRSLAATRVVLAANGGELGVGNEQHVRIAVVKVVNLKQSRLRAAFTGPSVDGAAVAVAREDPFPRIAPLPRRSRAPAVGVIRTA